MPTLSNEEWVEEYRACIASRSSALVNPAAREELFAALAQGLVEGVMEGPRAFAETAVEILLRFGIEMSEAQEIPQLCVEQLAG